MITDKERLQNHCNEIAKGLEELMYECNNNNSDVDTFYDYLQDVLDFRYVINADRSYRSCMLLVAFGGPNIWINTDTGYIEGYWWLEKVQTPINSDTIDWLDEMMEEFYDCQ